MTIQELTDLAWKHNAVVVYGKITTAAIVFSRNDDVHVICMPMGKHRHPWSKRFLLAHEVGHLVLGHEKLGGYGNGVKANWVMGIEANHWAEKACLGRYRKPNRSGR